MDSIDFKRKISGETNSVDFWKRLAGSEAKADPKKSSAEKNETDNSLRETGEV